jgi:hypothetical protein
MQKYRQNYTISFAFFYSLRLLRAGKKTKECEFNGNKHFPYLLYSLHRNNNNNNNNLWQNSPFRATAFLR